ncbi:MAG: protein kinase domain-containing protein, partial [Ktedonobacterales bacterium]
MQCPRCGQINEGRASLCVRCGAVLPAGMPWSGPLSPRYAPSGPETLDGIFREDDAQFAESSDRIPQWLARELQQTGHMPSVPPTSGPGQSGEFGASAGRMPDPYQPFADRGTPFPGRPFGGPPALAPTPSPFDSRPPFGASAPSILPDGSMRPALGGLSSGAPSRPASSNLNSAPQMDARPLGPANPGAGQFPTQDGMALVQPLGPGTLLKGGRYRLLQRFHAAGVPEPQGNEPPVMLASDTDQPNGRVLIQEVLINGAYPEDAERVRRSIAQRLEVLAHSGGLSPLVDNFTERRRHFLVFELPSGELLSDRLARARGPLDETQAIGYALQLLDVLRRFERERPPFLHGNICPSNILLRQSGQVVLLGVSTTLLLHPEGVVEHGQAAGIPGYAGPEQARGQATTRSDLYTVCAVLHVMVTGTTPAPRPTPLFQPARRLNPEVSLELEEVLGQGLRPSPTQRFQSVAELRAALEPLASGRRATHVPDDLRDPAGARPALAPVRDAKGRLVLPRHRTRAMQNPLVLLGTVLALIVLIGGGVLYVVSPHLPAHSGATGIATTNDRAGLYQSKGIALSGG